MGGDTNFGNDAEELAQAHNEEQAEVNALQRQQRDNEIKQYLAKHLKIEVCKGVSLTAVGAVNKLQVRLLLDGEAISADSIYLK